MIDAPDLKPVIWVGSNRKDFREFPIRGKIKCVTRCMSRSEARNIWTPGLSRDLAARVGKVVRDHRGDIFRTVHTVRLAGVVYELHAFQKTSKTGRETRRPKST
jgi:phage-related protein